MNWTIDLINSWADKFTYRILQLTGATDDQLAAFVQGITAKQNQTATADTSFNDNLNIAEILKYAAVVGGLFLVYRIYKLYKGN